MMVFQAALAAGKKGEKFDVIGETDVRFGTIHQDDLADLFLRVAERVSHVSNPFRANERHLFVKEMRLSDIIPSLNDLPISSMLLSEYQVQKDTV